METQRNEQERTPAAQEEGRQPPGASISSGNNARKRLLEDTPVTERWLQLAGISTSVLEGGDGPPIILLHGPGESAIWWMHVIPDLVTTHHVIAPDLPGHGASGVGDAPLDATTVVAWLEELIEETCASAPVLVGHALGGAIAARFAARRATRIDQLVLVDSLGLGPFRPAPAFAFELVRFMVRPTEHAYQRFLGQCMYDPGRLREQMGQRWEPFLAYQLDSARNSTVRSALRSLMREVGVPVIPQEDLARITIPTTLIWGRHDRAVSLRVAETASARYGWPLHVIENARDDPKLEQPEAFMEALRTVLAGTAGAGKRNAPSETSTMTVERRK